MQSTARILEQYEEIIEIDKKKQKEREYRNSKEYKQKQKEKLQRRHFINFVILFCVTLFSFTSIAMLYLFAKVRSTTLDEEIKMMQQQVEIQEAEFVRLKAERDALYNGAELIEYAEKNLGMQKAESYQIQYINLSEGDEIVISGNKVPKQKQKTEDKAPQIED